MLSGMDVIERNRLCLESLVVECRNAQHFWVSTDFLDKGVDDALELEKMGYARVSAVMGRESVTGYEITLTTYGSQKISSPA